MNTDDAKRERKEKGSTGRKEKKIKQFVSHLKPSRKLHSTVGQRLATRSAQSRVATYTGSELKHWQ